MGKYIDLTGQRFGRLIAIKRVEDRIYKNNKNKTSYWLCKCDCGNEIVVSKGNLRRGHTKSCGCYRKEISGENSRNTLKEVQNEFIKRNLIPLFDSYKSNNEKLLARTKEGYKVVIRLANLTMKRGWRIFDISNPYTIENIKLWLQLNKKPYKLLSNDYNGSKKDLQWECLKCDEIFYANFNEIKRLKSCPCCTSRQITISNCLATKRPDLVKEWHPTKNGNLTPYDVTPGTNKKVWWLCSNSDCHWEWEVTINNRDKHNCPKCSIKEQGIKRSTPKFKKDSLLKNNPKLCKEWNYDKNEKGPECYYPNSHFSVWWKCLKCGHEWESVISDRNKNMESGCPKCNKSNGEKKIENWLKSKNILFKSQFKFYDCKNIKPLPFDFYLPKINVVIEFDGLQHHQSIIYYGGEESFNKCKKNDQIKNNYCKQNNIKLYRIPYWEFKNIEQILDNIIHIKDYKEFAV